MEIELTHPQGKREEDRERERQTDKITVRQTDRETKRPSHKFQISKINNHEEEFKKDFTQEKT